VVANSDTKATLPPLTIRLSLGLDPQVQSMHAPFFFVFPPRRRLMSEDHGIKLDYEYDGVHALQRQNQGNCRISIMKEEQDSEKHHNQEKAPTTTYWSRPCQIELTGPTVPVRTLESQQP